MKIKKRPRHPEKVNKPFNPIKKKPEWIKSKLLNSKEFFLTKTVVNKDNLAYENYIAMRNRNNDKQAEMDSMRKELDELKSLLNDLASKITS